MIDPTNYPFWHEDDQDIQGGEPYDFGDEDDGYDEDWLDEDDYARHQEYDDYEPEDYIYWNHDEDVEDTHTGFYASVDGIPIHVLGDPDMSEDDLDAVKRIVKSAVDYVNALPHDHNFHAMTDKEIEDAEREDREFQMCYNCGQPWDDCQCEVDENDGD
jgi:hypothetical protein